MCLLSEPTPPTSDEAIWNRNGQSDDIQTGVIEHGAPLVSGLLVAREVR